jgi:glycosyltransferase involved in cell wall biosynthesis
MLAPPRLVRIIKYRQGIKNLADSATLPTRRRLLVDVSVLRQSDSRTGIQRVVRAILIGLLEQAGEHFEIQPVFASQTHPYRYCGLSFLRKEMRHDALEMDGLVLPLKNDVFVGLDLATHLLPLHEHQIKHWKSRGVGIAILVYDLLPLQNHRWFTSKLRGRFRRWLKLIERQADEAVCISQTVAGELQDRFSARRQSGGGPRISAIKLGGDLSATAPSCGLPADAESVLAACVARPTILMVGTIEPRKAYSKAIAAFERLWRGESSPPPALLIVGKPGWKTMLLQRRLRRHPQAGSSLFWLDDVSDEYLGHLYRAARGVMMASYAEGCGLPVLEALAHGTPVLARDLPVFREIDADGVTFFNDDRPGPLAAAITDFVATATPLDPSRQAGTERAWEGTVRSLINVINALNPEP